MKTIECPDHRGGKYGSYLCMPAGFFSFFFVLTLLVSFSCLLCCEVVRFPFVFRWKHLEPRLLVWAMSTFILLSTYRVRVILKRTQKKICQESWQKKKRDILANGGICRESWFWNCLKKIREKVGVRIPDKNKNVCVCVFFLNVASIYFRISKCVWLSRVICCRESWFFIRNRVFFAFVRNDPKHAR